MSYWQQVETAAGMVAGYHWVLLGCVVLAFVLARLAPVARLRMRATLILIAASFLGMLGCGLLLHSETLAQDAAEYRYLHFSSQLLFALAVVNLAGVLLFRVLLPPIRLAPAPILRDTLLGVAYVVVVLTLLSSHGADISGIVVTSAVVTAIIGFSLQDTLGNVMGGVALQMEQSIMMGDWIRVGEVEGRVQEIRWRQTSIETRNWDTVVIPNSVLMKSQVTVLGRRDGQAKLHRMWVDFSVDYRHSPGEVIDLVERALQAEPIPNVATEPAPNCILQKFMDSAACYAVRYWLTDFAKDDPTSSEVRARIFVALQRAEISISIPSQSVFLTMEGRSHNERKQQEELQRRTATLNAAELFAPLNEQERIELAGRLNVAPFRRGEIITHQGNQAHYLYLLTKGEAVVSVEEHDEGREVAILRAGDVFGEMGLMTGEPRSATVKACTDVTCYRLDKDSFGDVLKRRPEIAEAISHLMVKRKLELDDITEGLSIEAAQRHRLPTENDLLQRIRKFFMLD